MNTQGLYEDEIGSYKKQAATIHWWPSPSNQPLSESITWQSIIPCHAANRLLCLDVTWWTFIPQRHQDTRLVQNSTTNLHCPQQYALWIHSPITQGRCLVWGQQNCNYEGSILGTTPSSFSPLLRVSGLKNACGLPLMVDCCRNGSHMLLFPAAPPSLLSERHLWPIYACRWCNQNGWGGCSTSDYSKCWLLVLGCLQNIHQKKPCCPAWHDVPTRQVPSCTSSVMYLLFIIIIHHLFPFSLYILFIFLILLLLFSFSLNFLK